MRVIQGKRRPASKASRTKKRAQRLAAAREEALSRHGCTAGHGAEPDSRAMSRLKVLLAEAA